MYDIYPHICRGEQNRQFHIRNTKWLHLTPKQEARTISSSDWVNEHRINMRFVYIHAEHGSIHREWNTFFMALAAQLPAVASCFLRFLGHTQQRTTVGRTPLDEWSARRMVLFLDNTQQSQQTNIHSPSGIRTYNLSRRAAADLLPNCHWDWLLQCIQKYYFVVRIWMQTLLCQSLLTTE